MKLSEQSKKALKNTYLKELYPEAEQRKIYAQKKLKDSILPNPIVVRLEPYPKTKLLPVFSSMVLSRQAKISELNSYVHKKILNLNEKTSLFFIMGPSLVAMGKKIKDLTSKQAEYEKILFIQYSDQDPF